MSKGGTKPNLNKGDYRPTTDTKDKSKLTKPIYNAADYRTGFNMESKASSGKGGAKKAKKAKIFHYSRRLAPGATRDPWGGRGR